MSLTLGIDVGTSGVRTAVVDEGGTVISMARSSHPPQISTEIDAEDWWNAVQTCLNNQATKLREIKRSLAEVKAIAVDGTSGSMVLTDADLNPVSQALMYNSKGFFEEAAAIARLAPDPHIARGSNSALARAARLVRTAHDAPDHLLHQADFITARLLGEGGKSDVNNCLKTGCDPKTRSWPEWIGSVVPRTLLPELYDVGSKLGVLKPEMANAFGFDKKTVVAAGTTDSIAAFLACAPLRPGIAVTSLGSTLAVKVLSEHAVDDPEIGLYSHKIGDVWLTGGASNTGGAVLRHFFTDEEIGKLSQQIDPSRATGLEYYPLLKPGERFPINDPEFAGKTEPRPTNDAEFLAGLFEGIADIELRCYQAIEARGGTFPNIIYSAGGGAQNEVFARMRFAKTQTSSGTSEHHEAAVGAAHIAAWAIGAR